MNVNLKAFLITAGLVLLAAFSFLFIVQNMALAGNLFIIACLFGWYCLCFIWYCKRNINIQRK